MKQIILFFLVSLLLVSPVLAYSVPDDTIVYVTPSGTKYHRKDCTYTTATSSLTIQEAESRGYGPCSRCNPNIFQGEYIPPETSHSSSSSSSHSSSSPSSGSIDRPVDAEQSKDVSEIYPTENSVSNEVVEASHSIDNASSQQASAKSPSTFLSVIVEYVRYAILGFKIIFSFFLICFSPIWPYLIYRFIRFIIMRVRSSSSHSSPSLPSQSPLPVLPLQPQSAISEPAAPKSPLMVYFSLHSKVFHRENCGCLSRSKHVVGATITYAFNHQMTPCKICRPMDLVTSYEYVRWQDAIDPNSIQGPDDPVYFPLSGSFYHEKSCPTLQHQANIVSSNLRTAVLQNKRQCPVCKPVRRVPIKYSLSAPID